MIISEQEKNRILNLHLTSKNVNGVLISEQKDSQTAYFVRVAWTSDKNLKAGNTKTKGNYDFGKGNTWWKASYPDQYRDRDISAWNGKYPEGDTKKYIRISKKSAGGTAKYYWEMGPFRGYNTAIKAWDEWEDFSWEEAELIKRCGSGAMLSNYKTITMDQECEGEGEGDVASETIGGTEFDSVIFSDSLDVNNMPTFDPTKESEIYSCKMKGCSAWVSDTLNQWQGNAWHAHKNGRNKYSTYEKAGTTIIPAMVNLFNLVNKNPKEKSQETEAMRISKSLVPSQENFSNLKIDDIVGLFYGPSENHTKAFYEGMTGYAKMGGEKAAADGPFMVKADGSGQWSPDDLGQNIKFKAGNTLSGGQSPGINTHLGFVGAIVDGEPIIFHNIDKQVYATPLSKMSKNKTAIVWARAGGGGGTTETTVEDGEKTTFEKNTELLQKGLNLLYKKGKEYFD